MVSIGGCSCETPSSRDAPPSPDVMDAIEPCALGIRRAAMDLPAGVEYAAIAGGDERLWVADAVGTSSPTGRVTELSLDGTRLSTREVALPTEVIAPHAMVVLPGEPLAVWWGSSRYAVRVAFDAEPTIVLVPEAGLDRRTTDAGHGVAFLYGDGVMRLDRAGSVSSVATGDGVTTVSMRLFPGEVEGVGHGIGTTIDETLALLTYDFATTPPTLESRDLGLPTAPIHLSGRDLRGFARTEAGYVVSTHTLDMEVVRTVWFDEDFVEVARHEQAMGGDARVLGIVSGPYGELIVVEVWSPLGLRELRVLVADAPGVVRGGTRALVSSDTDGGGHLDLHVWSAIEGSVSVAYQRRGLVEVVTLCAPL